MLHVHRASRADSLVGALAGLLSATSADPFTPEVVSVPTRGMERWLAQRMSHLLGAEPGRDDGVCANVRFPAPRELLAGAVATAAGVLPEHDPWLPERMVWPLLEVVERSLHEPWLSTLSAHLGRGGAGTERPGRARRLMTVTRLAALFDRYARHRPVMLDAWRAGRDEDGSGEPLAEAFAWQAELWRRLRARIGAPDASQRAAEACERIAREPAVVELPPRLALFGLTRLAAGELRVLEALATGRDVHLFLLHPSPELWRRLGCAPAPSSPLRSVDATGELVSNRLLASWGRDAREMQLVLRSCAAAADHPHDPEAGEPARSRTELGEPARARPLAGEPAHTLLAAIQADVRADRQPPGPPLPGRPDARFELAAEDRSIEIHACHGRARQVEVLREAVLDALASDPTLEPRDVIVMCPDVESFAPLIQATFERDETASPGPGPPEAEAPDPEPPEPEAPDPEPPEPEAPDPEPPEAEAPDPEPPEPEPSDHRSPAAERRGAPPGPIDLRVRLADRSIRRTNPVLDAVARLLELAERRLTASEVLDLAGRAAVRRRFRFDDDELSLLAQWVAEAGIRWGLDAEHRVPFRLEALDAGTWRAGLDRLLLGVAMSEDGGRLFGGALALDGVADGSIDLAGRFAELLSRLGAAMRSLSEARTPAGWAEAIAEAANSLTAAGPREGWQRAELARVLEELVAGAGESAPVLEPAEIRAHLAERLAGRPTRSSFRTGHLTVCTLEPMRSVPHRVVCLLGLDDGAFPRRAPRDGDDLTLPSPRIGERDPRSEDRQLLLDALLAATERLIVTYAGRDERTGSSLPPAVPIGELLDAIDATARAGDLPASSRVVVRHPLQPFHPRNFIPGAVAGHGPWSFDRAWLSGAEALAGPRRPPGRLLDAPLAHRPPDVVELDDLVRFVQRPVRAFLSRRLDIALRDDDEETADSLTIKLDPLQVWGVGDRLLRARLRGVGEREAILAEIARGTLPPGVLGMPVITRVSPIVTAILRAVNARLPPCAPPDPARAEPLDARVALDGGRILSGTVAGVVGDVVLSSTFSRVGPRERLAAWARLLALSATWPQRPFTAVTVGRASGDDDIRTVTVGPLGDSTQERRAVALEQLALLLDLHDRGMREPLPIAARSSFAYAEAARAGGDPSAAAAAVWDSDWRRRGEDVEPEHVLAFGGVVRFAELAAATPRDGEDGARPSPADGSRFGLLALRLWDELLSRSDVSSR